MALPQWSDTAGYSEHNQKGFIVLPTAIPIGDNLISDADLAIIEEQSNGHALAIQQMRSIALREVEAIDAEKPRPISEDAPLKKRREWEQAMTEWRKRKQSAEQMVAAEREVFSFSMAIVGAETLAQTAVKIAVDAYMSKNYLAFHGGWEEWCEMASAEIRRIGKATNRNMSDKTIVNISGRIRHYLPAFLNQISRGPLLLPDGTEVTPDWLIDNPGILSEAGSLIKGIDQRARKQDGPSPAFAKVVKAYSTLPQRDFRKQFSASNQYTEKEEKLALIKENVEEVDQETHEVKVRTKYTLYADSAADEEWIEVQLKARFDVAYPAPVMGKKVKVRA